MSEQQTRKEEEKEGRMNGLLETIKDNAERCNIRQQNIPERIISQVKERKETVEEYLKIAQSELDEYNQQVDVLQLDIYRSNGNSIVSILARSYLASLKTICQIMQDDISQYSMELEGIYALLATEMNDENKENEEPIHKKRKI